MQERLIEPVAAVFLCLMADGSILEDPSVSFGGQDANNQNPIVCELLYAGTKDSVVMMEFSGELEESRLIDLIYKAHECIQPRLEIQNKVSLKASSKEVDLDDDALRKELGLESVESVVNEERSSSSDDNVLSSKAEIIYEQAYQHCKEKLWDVALRLFGVTLNDNNSGNCLTAKDTTTVIHSEDKDGPLLGKAHRGRRESLFHEEIKRRLIEFVPTDKGLSNEFRDLVIEDSSVVATLAEAIHSKMLKEAMEEAVGKYDCRSDGRSNSKVVRPLSMKVPALPDVVHGSALFTRGETQVLCTTTLGPPKDGILLNDPYISTPSKEKDKVDSPYSNLPVGSLRYLKNQEYLVSDLNSRKVKASREQTGDSGTLRERRRAFLQYDFPSYSKGEIQSGPASSASRREIGKLS
jgi:polyribonucleotide nucleotidyltransferase